MIINRYILKDLGFVLTEIIGRIDDDKIVQYVKEFNIETESISNLRELADCRKLVASNNLTGQGLMESALSLADRKDSLLAVLIEDTYDLHFITRVYKTFSETRRKSVKIFTDLEGALSWLANDDHEFEVLKKFVYKKLMSSDNR